MLASLAARQSLRVGVTRALKGDDVAAKLRLRKGLIVAQLALSVIVLVAAALFTQTVNELRLVDPGFEHDRVLIASTATDGYTPEQRTAFYARLLDNVRSLPGVVSAALASDAPLDVHTGWNIVVQRDPSGPPRQAGASVAALVLSSVGLYGVMANAVSRRKKELGIRLALGAEPRRILRLVLGEAGLLLALGAAAGLPCALLTGRAIRSLLFGVQSGDWKSIAAALGVLMTVAAFAAWIPARRASRVDPMAALRCD